MPDSVMEVNCMFLACCCLLMLDCLSLDGEDEGLFLD
jgi:hypothetical protein